MNIGKDGHYEDGNWWENLGVGDGCGSVLHGASGGAIQEFAKLEKAGSKFLE